MLKIHSYETMSANDGPGLRTVFFLQGCNFRCQYCHNPDTQECDGRGQLMSDDEIIKVLKKNMVYYGDEGGVTFSGGEALLQAENLLKVMRRIKQELQLSIAVDTNGSIMQEKAKEVLKEADLVIFDLKHIDEKKHLVLTGKSNKWVKEGISWRESHKKSFWMRYVLVPGVTDEEKDLRAWANYVSQFKYLKRVEIVPYHTLGLDKYKKLNWKYELEGVRAAKLTDVEKAKQIMNLPWSEYI